MRKNFLKAVCEYVNASVNTPFGKLVSNWKINENGAIAVTITIPKGAKARVILSAKERVEELIGGGEYNWNLASK